MSNCAECTSRACVRGSRENTPSNCPGLSHSSEMMFELYPEEERNAARQSALVEAEGYIKNTRLEETMDYAYKMGYRHLGVAFCAALWREGQTLCSVLRENGFLVDSVCCKNGCVSKRNINISREQQSIPQNEYEGMCNPAGQALVLDEAGVDFAILMGLCVGHDTLFFKHIQAPCTVFAVKDRVMAHNPMGAIYTSNFFMRRVNSFIRNKYGTTLAERDKA